MKPWSGPGRADLIRLVHVGKRELMMDDDTYRATIGSVIPGKSSAKDLSTVQLQRLLDHLKSKGFQVRSKAGTRRLCDIPTSKKIRALWLSMHAEGIVRSKEESALAAFVKRHTGVDALQWLTDEQASLVIETLKQWQSRELSKRKSS